ncbi:MAG: formylglycine-generating enzyme family protein, partial [Pseudomonadales bacterium]|nr:formylglycine-generating enzyme family protein [Pseudomonadales bacterium]
MHTQNSLNLIKNHNDLDKIAPGLIHISVNKNSMDDLIEFIEKYLNSNFYTSKKNNQITIHYQSDHKVLNYSHLSSAHFYVIQSINKLVEKDFSFFLYKPLLNEDIFALLVVSNKEFENFVQSNGLWFDKNFKRLQNNFDGFSDINGKVSIDDSSADLIRINREKHIYQVDRAKRITKTMYTLMAIIIVSLCIGTYIIFLNLTGEWELKSKQFSSYLTQFSNKEKIPKEQLNQYVGNLILIPEGSFMMGHEEKRSLPDAYPVHKVTLNSFLMMETELTFDHWGICVNDGACSDLEDEGWGRNQKPVINVSYDQITEQYIPWLYNKTGYRFTLPSESQWEYAARAGTQTKYSFGDDIACDQAHFGFNASHKYFSSSEDCFKISGKTSTVKKYPANQFGLYDMHGNVAELVADQYKVIYEGARTD